MMIIRPLLIAATLLAITASAAPGTRMPPQPAEQGLSALERLTYSSYRPAGSDLYLYSSSGSEPRRLTDHPALDYEATFSADGRWIVFTSERDGNPSLYLLDLEAEAPPRLLVRSDAMQDQATLSPDGRWLAFVSTHGGDADIYLLPFEPDSIQDASDAVNLTNHPGGDFRPAFSPDSTRIAFSSDRDGVFSRDPSFPFVVRHEGDIYVVNVDGSRLQCRMRACPGTFPQSEMRGTRLFQDLGNGCAHHSGQSVVNSMGKSHSASTSESRTTARTVMRFDSIVYNGQLRPFSLARSPSEPILIPSTCPAILMC